MISRVVLTTFPIFFVSACQSGLLIWGNAASLSIDVDIPNKVLFLTYEFESPVRAAKFLNTPERARNSSWSVLDSEIELNGNVLTRIDSRPFQRATIKVGIEEDSTKQGESALSAIGDVGLVLFGPYIWLERITLTDITANIGRGQVVVHGGLVSNVGAEEVLLEGVLREIHRVYFGYQTSISYVGNAIVASSIEPENHALTVIRDSVEPVMHWIDTFFGTSSQNRPFIIVSFSETDDSNYAEISGTTVLTTSNLQTSSGEMLLRFKGDSRTWEGKENEYAVQRTLVHELVHFSHFKWWGNPRFAQSWLVEGLADYLAIKYAHSVGGYAGEQTFLSEIERLASECLNILETGNFGISRAHPQVGMTPFHECGVLAYWLIDGRPRVAHRADRLGMVLARMKETPGTFSVRKLRRAMETVGENEASEPLQMLIEGPRSRIWQRRDEVLQEAGISVPSPSDDPSVLGTTVNLPFLTSQN